MATQDYYQVLGLSRECDQKDIRNAFKKMALLWHPVINIHYVYLYISKDKNVDNKQQAEIKFNQIYQAYQILCDDDKRRTYDTLGHCNFNNNQAPYDLRINLWTLTILLNILRDE